MVRTLVAIVVVLFASHAVAADVVGKVKLCRADGRAQPAVTELVAGGAELAGDGTAITIPAKATFRPGGNGCVITTATASGGRPAKGAQWRKDFTYKSAVIDMSGGKQKSEEVDATATVTAEAVEDFAPVKEGKIKVCRMPGIMSITDGKPVAIPAGTYTGATDKRGNSRSFEIAADGATLGAGKHACVTLSAKVVEGDGAPIKAGERLDAQWSVTGFEPRATVVTAFK